MTPVEAFNRAVMETLVSLMGKRTGLYYFTGPMPSGGFLGVGKVKE